MRTVVLIMAGGRGERIRRSFGPMPKPLVPVLGVPLLERNVLQLLGQGWREIAVSVPADPPLVADFLETRIRSLTAALDARLQVITERVPLGNIGCARLVAPVPDEVVVTFADNLTTLDSRDVVSAHRDANAALTLAIHEQPVPLAYGQVDVSDGWLTEYSEKPVRNVLIATGVAVLGREALEAIAADRPVGMSGLARTLLARGERIRTLRHSEAWVDVNDAEAHAAAERLVAVHADRFECWTSEPDEHVVRVVVCRDGDVIVNAPAPWTAVHPGPFPSRSCSGDPDETDAVAVEISTALGVSTRSPRLVTRFDDVDVRTGRVVRNHVFLCCAERYEAASSVPGALTWAPLSELASGPPADRLLLRVTAALSRIKAPCTTPS